MSRTLNIRAFFFNAKTDYLPYYKNFRLQVEDDSSAKELLGLIHAQNENFAYPKQKLIMKINGLVVEGKEKLKNIIEKLGTELTIDPANTYRSMHGLKIKDDDFMAAYALLEPYATEADLKFYKSLYALHYASETEHFDHSYIGDAVLVLAHKMISEGNEHKTEILNAISSVDSGLFDCEYENNLFHAQDHTDAIESLKEMVRYDDDAHPSLLEMIMARFAKDDQPQAEKTQRNRSGISMDDLEEKVIAYYPAGSEDPAVKALTEAHGSRTVTFSRALKLSGVSLYEDNRTLALKKAGATLLDAYDSGAELLVVEDDDTYTMMQENFSAIEKTVGREMPGLALISSVDFVAQLEKTNA